MNVCERFINYVKIDTQSDPESKTVPSTAKQLELTKILYEELLAMGADEVYMDDNAYVYAALKATPGCEELPSIGFIAHLDTSPDVTDTDVKPRIIENYDGKDIVLNEELGIVTSVESFPSLKNYVGKDLIVTDGTTLLGADDKAGVAEIMCALEKLKDVPHGRVAVCFTPDEEIGHGASKLDLDRFGCEYAYTVDGGELGEISYETFNAASAWVEVKGLNVHPGSAKNVMKNASLIAMEFDSLLPVNERPQYTCDYEGFFHLGSMSGDESSAKLSYIIRDHDRNLFVKRKDIFKSAEAYLNAKYGEGTVNVKIRDGYFNMAEVLSDKMYIVERAQNAMKACGVEPYIIPVRGGTDGSALSFRGLPCPNLCTGGMNFHGINELICIQSMEAITDVLVEIAKA